MSGTETVVVGGGVAGLYAAWRLARAGQDVRVLEAGDRLGGRLWSLPMRSPQALPAELGGMFFNDNQPLVHGLCAEVFDLPRQRVTPEPDFAWLRGHRFRVEAFADPSVLPYGLRPDEQGLSYGALLMLAITRIAPDIGRYWPMNPDSSREAALAYLQGLEVDGRPLHAWGFWNLLSRVISNEAWLALRDIISSWALFSNWNGYDALVSAVLEQSGQWYRLVHGYQQLPVRLAEDARSRGAVIQTGCTVRSVHRSSAGWRLEVDGAGGGVQAQRLVLALPAQALAQLVAASPVLHDSRLQACLGAVAGIPACKVFLTFPQPWWRDLPEGPGKIREGSYGVSHTDLPLRQCYYLGVDADSGEGLMLASYADGDATSFWRALAPDSGREGRLESGLSGQALREVCRQLSEMHGVAVPAPSSGVFIDWSARPFGGGWHAWQPGWKSWELTGAMLAPVDGLPLYVCGESFSSAQGWVQGALESTEAMLQSHFGLEAPAWLHDAACLAPYDDRQPRAAAPDLQPPQGEPQMPENTRNFLKAVGSNPELAKRFRKEPKAVMDEHKVPAEHQKLILAGDRDGLQRAAGLSEEEVRWFIL